MCSPSNSDKNLRLLDKMGSPEAGLPNKDVLTKIKFRKGDPREGMPYDLSFEESYSDSSTGRIEKNNKKKHRRKVSVRNAVLKDRKKRKEKYEKSKKIS